jgi:hypothetical protein
MYFPEINWVVVGSIIGVFWGLFGVLFYRPKAVWKSFPGVVRSVMIIIFQFFFQFIGGFAGAMGLGLFLDRFSQNHLGIPELLLLAISLVGVSGKLSDVIYRIPGYMSVAFGPRDQASK